MGHHSLHRRYSRCCVEESGILPSNGQTRHCPEIIACPVVLVQALEVPFIDSTRMSPLYPLRNQVRRRLILETFRTEIP